MSGKIFNPTQISELTDYFYWGYVYDLETVVIKDDILEIRFGIRLALMFQTSLKKLFNNLIESGQKLGLEDKKVE